MESNPNDHQWMRKQTWSIHTMTYYPAMKRITALIQDTTRVTLKTWRVQEASHKRPHVMTPFIQLSRMGKSIESRE